jgi:hypothetical protein
MSQTPAPPPTEPAVAEPGSVARASRLSISEDWAATVVGLALIALTLAGFIPTGLVP